MALNASQYQQSAWISAVTEEVKGTKWSATYSIMCPILAHQGSSAVQSVHAVDMSRYIMVTWEEHSADSSYIRHELCHV